MDVCRYALKITQQNYNNNGQLGTHTYLCHECVEVKEGVMKLFLL